MWLSLVERCVRDAEVASSNLVISTKKRKGVLRPFLFLLESYNIEPATFLGPNASGQRVSEGEKDYQSFSPSGLPKARSRQSRACRGDRRRLCDGSGASSNLDIPPEVLKACFQGAGRGNHEAKRIYLVIRKDRLSTVFFLYILFLSRFIYAYPSGDCYGKG